MGRVSWSDGGWSVGRGVAEQVEGEMRWKEGVIKTGSIICVGVADKVIGLGEWLVWAWRNKVGCEGGVGFLYLKGFCGL
jgi:hypothetical protein